MDVSLAVTAAQVQGLQSVIDAAGPGAKLSLFDCERPAPGGTAATSALVSISLAHPCGSVAGITLTLADTDFAQVARSGDAAWARIEDADGIWVADLNVGVTPAPGAVPPLPEVRLASTQLYAGSFVGLIGAVIVGVNPAAS